jgi:hypothetical protein
MQLVTLAEMAANLEIPISRVHQLLRDGQLVAVADADGTCRVPELFVQQATIVKSLPAVIRLLRDNHYRDEEIVEWLFREDASLPGSPIAALRENRGTEVKRRAQAAGY